MELQETPAAFYDNLSWGFAERNDAEVIGGLINGKPIDAIYNLDERALMDDFFHFLQEEGVLNILEGMEASSGTIQREMVDFRVYVILYLLKTLHEIESMNALPELLFQDEMWMKWVGFNAYQIRNGICDRGKFRKKKKKATEAEKDEKAEVRGPLVPRTLANNIVKLSSAELECTFRRCIRRLAERGHFQKKVTLILDTTDLEVTERYEGAGWVIRERQIEDKIGKLHTIEVKVFGWKVGVIFEALTRVPVAFKVAKINEPDVHFLKALMLQALSNLEPYCKVENLVIDRGFIDGPALWWLKQEKGIDFVIPARKDMHIYKDALALAEKYAGNTACPEIVKAERVVKKQHGKGKEARTELLTTRIVGVSDLKTYDSYGPVEEQGTQNKKDFKGNPLNAVVVKMWQNREYGPHRGVVFITSRSVAKPFVVFDLYDERSLIENCLFREGKQKWDLQHLPQKNEQAAHVHVFFVLLTMTLTTLFRRWKQKQETLLDAGQMVGIERYRRRLKAENRDKIILFFYGMYAILYTQEMAILGGFNLRQPSFGIGTREDILRKYGVKPP